jgi:hypothetical protein
MQAKFTNIEDTDKQFRWNSTVRINKMNEAN